MLEADVSRETGDLLRQYESLLIKWNPSINLVAPSTLTDFRKRHVRDSTQIFSLTKEPQGNWIDLGSGGGLPGLVIAILARELPLLVTLVESDKRKAAFLSTCRRELDLPKLTILNQRIEQLPESLYDFASARALAPLADLLPMLDTQLAPHGRALLHKGRNWRDEVAEARRHWDFDLATHDSTTDPDAAILEISEIERRE